MTNFRIKVAAREDLKSIARYTEEHWGREKRNNYLHDIDHAFQQLASNNKLGKRCDHIRAGYRSFPIGSHIIFYLIGDDEMVEIIRVLHERMDVSVHVMEG